MSLRLTPPEPPPEFLYEPAPRSEAPGRRWIVSGAVILVVGASLAIGAFVIHGLKDTLFAEGALVPVIAPQERPLKQRAGDPAAPDAATGPQRDAGRSAETERPPTPSQALRAIVAATARPDASSELPSPEVPEPPAFAGNVDAAATPATSVEAAAPDAGPATVAQTAAVEPEAFAIEVIPATTMAAAKREWARLQQVHPALLGDTSLELRRVTIGDDRVLYRGLVGRLPSLSTAEDFCAQLTVLDRNQDCRVLPRPSLTQLAARPTAAAVVPGGGRGEPSKTLGADKPAGDDADPNLVRLTKFALKRAGFDPGPLDSRTTPQLAASIKAYQQRHGLPEDGQASRPLLDHMLGGQVAKSEIAPRRTPAASPAPQPRVAAKPQIRPATASPTTTQSGPQEGPAVARVRKEPPGAPAPRVQAASTNTARIKVPKATPTTGTPASVTEPDWYITRGDDLLKLGDIVSARLFYEEAIGLGSAKAKKALARTFDPIFFANTGVRGPRPDARRAAALYGEAAEAGDREAQNRLKILESWLEQSQGESGSGPVE